MFRTVGESDGEGSATNEGNGEGSATQRHVLEMSRASKRAMGQFRDNITDIMWNDYVAHGNVRWFYYKNGNWPFNEGNVDAMEYYAIYLFYFQPNL